MWEEEVLAEGGGGNGGRGGGLNGGTNSARETV